MVQIGFMTSLKIGGTEMTADITCKDPENNASDKKVVGVMSYTGWTASATDPLKTFLASYHIALL